MATKTAQPYKGINIEFFEEKHQLFVNDVKNPFNITGITKLLDKSDQLTWWASGESVKELGWFNEKKIRREWKGTPEELEDKIANELATAKVIHEGIKNLSFEEYFSRLETARGKFNQKKTEAAGIGDIVHEFAEHLSLGLKPEIPENEKAKNGALAFLKWLDSEKIKISKPEQLLYSKKYGYWGIADAKGVKGKKTFNLEYKTSSGFYNDQHYQASAQLFAKQEMTGKKLDGSWLLRFDKETGEFEHKFIDPKESAKDFKAFLGLFEARKREFEKNGR